METFSDVLDYLPEFMHEIIRVVGIDAAIIIVQARGGVRLYVPKVADPTHWLANAIGVSAMAALIAEMGGDEIEIPFCKEALIAIKERAILKKAQSGKSQSALAREYKMTERGIRKLLRRAEKSHPDIIQQQPLF